ncbi:MAG: ABC transporter ATP-binding protein [Candidatus Firestonebacteria bacterium]|nr:ABC transporter ATP-binding protein [Candidatus Firestonebacteria bacterium]
MKLEIKNVSKHFYSKNGKLSAVENINLTINEGEFLSIVGPSGCGKSTLLNLIAGLETPDEGTIELDGVKITVPGPDRVVIFQEGALFPWLSVIKNVEFGLKMMGLSKEERREKAREFLSLVHLSKFENSFVHELSGGMKQRVSIARGLAMNPKILLLDEPFAALDSQTREILQAELQEIWMRTKKTFIFVTHNVQESVYLANRVLMFSASPGTIKHGFWIPLERPRSLQNMDLINISNTIVKELKDEVEKVIGYEFDGNKLEINNE